MRFGNLTLDGKFWVLDAEPHVVMRAKRLFPRLEGRHGDRLRITDTIDTCRDLAWFVERYPLEMTVADRVRLADRASEHQDRESLVTNILDGHIPPSDVDTALPMRQYQLKAIEVLKANRALLLADDMGLGKTAQAIGAMVDARLRPALVVTKTALPKQWEAEIRRFAPKLTTHIIQKGTPYDFRQVRGRRRNAAQSMLPGMTPDVLITNYHKLSGWAETLAEFIQFVVWDEVQEFRAGDSTNKGAAGFMLAKRVPYRLGLSGTPIFNLGHEMWPVMETIHPGALGSREEFIAEWCGYEDMSGRAALKNPKAFGTYVRDTGLLLRRTKEDVGLETPAVVRHIQSVEMDSKPLEEIEGAAERLARIILGSEAEVFERGQASSEMDNMVRQATGVAKAPYVAEFVKILLENDERVVLFGWHHSVYNIWAERLKNYNPVFFTGKQTAAQKQAAKDAFIKGDSKLLIMSLRSGEGVDGLQKVCRTVVFGELDWSPAVMEQDIARIDRPEQTNLVNVYFMLADAGSDPIMADVLSLKRAQVEGLRNPTTDTILQYDTEGSRIKELAKQYLTKAKAAA